MKFKSWRNLHIYSFGYWRLLSSILAVLFIIIFITGFFLNHRHEFRFLSRTQVPLYLLPGHYTDRVELINQSQSNLPVAKMNGAPLEWIVRDLHTGEFFGRWGIYFYDGLAAVLTLLGVSGLVMYLRLRTARKKVRKHRRSVE